MKFYEILPGWASERNVGSACTELPCLSWSAFCRWTILLRGCYSLSPEELKELNRYPAVRFETFEYPYDVYQLYEVYLFSERLRGVLEQQGLASSLLFIPVQLRPTRSVAESAWETFFAVRFGKEVCVPCLKPYPIYRVSTPDWIYGYTIYKRRNSLLIVDGSMVRERRLFVVSNVSDYALVVREDALEEWLDKDIVVEFQDVLLE